MTGAIIAPILPRMVQQLDLDPSTAGYLVSAHYLTVAIFSPLLGFLADRTGQLRVLVISLVLYALFGVTGGILSGYYAILLTRVLVGAASGGIAAATLGLLVTIYPSESDRSQAIAYVATVLTLANIVYPVLAGIVGSWHWRGVFLLYGLALPLALLASTTLKQGRLGASCHASSSAATMANAKTLMKTVKTPQILQLYLTQGLTAAIAHGTIIYLPLYMKATLNAGTALIGGVLAAQALGATAMSALGARRLTKRWGLAGVTAWGLGGIGLMLSLLPLVPQLSWLLCGVIGIGLGLGLVVPALYTWVARLAPAGVQSSVLALCVGANFLGQFVSPGLFGAVVNWQGLSGVFYAAAALSFLLCLVTITLRSSGLFKV